MERFGVTKTNKSENSYSELQFNGEFSLLYYGINVKK